jgi:hypothetical protein
MMARRESKLPGRLELITKGFSTVALKTDQKNNNQDPKLLLSFKSIFFTLK